jgi:hypothetical protein
MSLSHSPLMDIAKTMDSREHVMDQILNPRRENADQILEDLGLASFPTREQVHQEIEAKLLLPPDTIPEHWLSTYQMYVYLFFETGSIDFPLQTLAARDFHSISCGIRTFATSDKSYVPACGSRRTRYRLHRSESLANPPCT